VILDNCTVVTMNERREIVTDAAVAVVGSTIAAVGKSDQVRAARPDEPVRDLNGWVVMPGLVDGHFHLPQTLLRGAADELPIPRWMGDRIFPLEGAYTPEAARASARLAVLEMLKAGTTAFLETLILGRHGLDELSQAIAEMGIRAVLPRAISDGGGYLDSASLHPGIEEPPDDAIADALAVAAQWKGSDRIRIWLGPRSTGGCTEELLVRVVELARSEGMGLCQHYAQSAREPGYIRETFGCGQGELLERIGMLGPDVVLLHCTALEPEDIEILSGTGTHVVHCPTGPAKVGNAVTPVTELLEAGINIAIGSDGGPANNGADLIRDFKWVGYLQKLRKRDATVVPAETILEMATLGGARALGLDDLVGSVEVGRRADLIVIRTDGPHWTPNINWISNLAYASTGADVDTVMVDGEILMEGREMTTVDEERILVDARREAASLFERAGVEIPHPWPVL
jgi:cytosine/adenosine deaminase-related metal-dependent hydrolase